jgi:hypothetical protein
VKFRIRESIEFRRKNANTKINNPYDDNISISLSNLTLIINKNRIITGIDEPKRIKLKIIENVE